MVVINWNVGEQVTCCTLCQLTTHMYSDLGYQSNGKDFYPGNCHLNHDSSNITRDSTTVLLVWILYHSAGNTEHGTVSYNYLIPSKQLYCDVNRCIVVIFYSLII